MIDTYDLDSRLVILIISPIDVSQVLSGTMRIINLPLNARLMRASAPYEINGWALTFRHDSFDPVPEGLNIPHLQAICELVVPNREV